MPELDQHPTDTPESPGTALPDDPKAKVKDDTLTHTITGAISGASAGAVFGMLIPVPLLGPLVGLVIGGLLGVRQAERLPKSQRQHVDEAAEK